MIVVVVLGLVGSILVLFGIASACTEALLRKAQGEQPDVARYRPRAEVAMVSIGAALLAIGAYQYSG